MPYVNYIREHVAFIEYASDNGLSGNERLLWYALMHIMNQRAQGANYPDGFIRIANKRLLSYAPMQFDAMAKARNALQQRGLIEFAHGKRNAEMPMYKMNYFSCPADNPQDTPVPVDNSALSSTGYPLKTDNIMGNIGGNMQGKAQGNTPGSVSGNMGDIYNKLNVSPNPDRNPYGFEDENDPDHAVLCARARMHEEYGAFDDVDMFRVQHEASVAADKVFRATFNRQPTKTFVDRIGILAANFGMSPAMVEIAIREAAVKNASDVFAYVVALFRDWRYQEVTTPDEYGEYSYMRDDSNGKVTGIAHTDYTTMENARKERKRKHEAARGGGGNGCDSEEDI